MATLYRKYRPQTFDEALGQEHVKLTLKQEIGSGRLAHAYLFCGPRAVGKTTMARIFSKAVNCKENNGKAEPCNHCQSCIGITEGKSIDIIEIDAASNTGVDNVRENIIASARLTPVNSKFKVFIIDEVHMLSISSFNALLKIIEEPPAYIIFILCTTEVHKVPTTIISRCQRFDFRKISTSDIAKKLTWIAKEEKIAIDEKVIHAIARNSEGHVRDAESLFGQVISVASTKNENGELVITETEASLVVPRSDLNEALNLLDMIKRKDGPSAVSLVNKLLDEGLDMKVFTANFIELARKVMLNKLSPGVADKFGLDLGDALEKKVASLLVDFPLERVIAVIDRFGKAQSELKNSRIIQLPIELAIVELCMLEPMAKAPAGPAVVPSGKAPLQNPEPVMEKKSLEKASEADFSAMNSDSIRAKWDEFLIRLKKYNHSLSFILKVCEPRDGRENCLQLAFKYKFHKDRVTDPQIRPIIERVLAEVYGSPLSFEAIIDETIETAPASENGGASIAADASDPVPAEPKETGGNGADDVMNNLLKTFGGKVVS